MQILKKAVFLFSFLALHQVAHAGYRITVSGLADVPQSATTIGECTQNAARAEATCPTLRSAINFVNSSLSVIADTNFDIYLTPGSTYDLTRIRPTGVTPEDPINPSDPTARTPVNDYGDLDIQRPSITSYLAGSVLNIYGSPSDNGQYATIRMAAAPASRDRVFHVHEGRVNFHNIKITQGLLNRNRDTSCSALESRNNVGAGLLVEIGAEVGLYNTIVEINGTNCGQGGGIANFGRLVIVNSTIRGNNVVGTDRLIQRTVEASGGAESDPLFNYSSGGGIYNKGVLRLVNVTLKNNRAGRYGGGLYSEGPDADVLLVNTTFSENEAYAEYRYRNAMGTDFTYPIGQAGGLLNADRSKMRVVNSTFFKNRAFYNAGIANTGRATLRRSNTGDNPPAGGLFKIANTIIAYNTSFDPSTVGARASTDPFRSDPINMQNVPYRDGTTILNINRDLKVYNCTSQAGTMTSLKNNLWDANLIQNADRTVSQDRDNTSCSLTEQNTTDKADQTEPQPTGQFPSIGIFNVLSTIGTSAGSTSPDRQALIETHRLENVSGSRVSRAIDSWSVNPTPQYSGSMFCPPFDGRAFTRSTNVGCDIGAREESATPASGASPRVSLTAIKTYLRETLCGFATAESDTTIASEANCALIASDPNWWGAPVITIITGALERPCPTDAATIGFTSATHSFPENSGIVNIAVNRTGNLSVPTTISYSTSHLDPVSAFAGFDYGASGDPSQLSGVLSFSEGTTGTQTQNIRIPILDNASPGDPTRTFALSLSSPSCARLGTTRTEISITENEVPGTPSFNLSLDNPLGVAFSGRASLDPGTATSLAVFVESLEGFSDPISMTVETLPTGVTVNPTSPVSIAAGRTFEIITFTAASSAPPSDTTINLTGTSGGLRSSTSFRLVVNNSEASPPLPPLPPGDAGMGGETGGVSGEAGGVSGEAGGISGVAGSGSGGISGGSGGGSAGASAGGNSGTGGASGIAGSGTGGHGGSGAGAGGGIGGSGGFGSSGISGHAGIGGNSGISGTAGASGHAGSGTGGSGTGATSGTGGNSADPSTGEDGSGGGCSLLL